MDISCQEDKKDKWEKRLHEKAVGKCYLSLKEIVANSVPEQNIEHAWTCILKCLNHSSILWNEINYKQYQW